MKKLVLILFLVLILCINSFAAEMITIKVNGLVCDFCARALEKTFNNQDSVAGIDVDLTAKIVTIVLKEGARLDDAAIENLVTSAGYNVEEITRQ